MGVCVCLLTLSCAVSLRAFTYLTTTVVHLTSIRTISQTWTNGSCFRTSCVWQQPSMIIKLTINLYSGEIFVIKQIVTMVTKLTFCAFAHHTAGSHIRLMFPSVFTGQTLRAIRITTCVKEFNSTCSGRSRISLYIFSISLIQSNFSQG